jgi:hypothetical protein
VEFLAHAPGHVGIEVAERFIEQEQHGMLDQRSSEGHALLLATGQFMGIPSLEALQTDEAEHVLHAHFSLVSAQPSKAERNILLHTEVREQGILLKHHADVSVFGRRQMVRRRYQPSRQKDLTGPDGLKSGDGAQNGRFPASRWAQ